MKHIPILSRLCLLGALLMPLAATAQFDDPFSADASLIRTEAGETVLRVVFSVPEKHYLYADELAITVQGVEAELLSAPEPIAIEDPFMQKVLGVFKTDFEVRYAIRGELPDPLIVVVSYMGCDPEICFMPQEHRFSIAAGEALAGPAGEPLEGPETDAGATAGVFDGFRLIGREAGYMQPDDFIAFIDEVEVGRGLEKSRIEQLFSGHGVLIGILAILLGGLALNLTPCVLPMIPVNLAIIGAGAQAGSRRKGFLLGSTYGVGIALVYGLLGLVVVLTGAQFGTLNASPLFNIGIALLFILLALAMFGVFNLDFSRFQPTSKPAPKRGEGGRGGASYGTALIFGGVAALLAGACVAPVVISVLVLATEIYQRGSNAGLLLPFILGLGMALPWPFAGAGLSFLPKPGRWMERIKIGFGVVILAAALYYGMLGWKLLRLPAPADRADVTGNDVWLHAPEEAVARSKATGMPLFVDFWATWCKNCLAMDATTFKDAGVLEALSPYVRLKYQAENPRDPETKRVLDLLGVKGLPSYVILKPDP